MQMGKNSSAQKVVAALATKATEGLENPKGALVMTSRRRITNMMERKTESQTTGKELEIEYYHWG